MIPMPDPIEIEVIRCIIYAWILLGVVSIFLAVIVFIEGGFTHYGFFISGRFPGIVLLIIGIASFYMVPRALRYDEKKEINNDY